MLEQIERIERIERIAIYSIYTICRTDFYSKDFSFPLKWQVPGKLCTFFIDLSPSILRYYIYNNNNNNNNNTTSINH